MRRVLLLGLLFLYSSATVQAQSTNASLRGHVTDPSKALIIEARVTAISGGTNVVYQSSTDGSGEYQLAALPPGTYSLKVEKQGFKTIMKPGVILHVQDALRVDFEMAVGDVSETLTVERGAPVVNSES